MVKQEPDLGFSAFTQAQPDLTSPTADLTGVQFSSNAVKSLLELQETAEVVKQEAVADPVTNGGIVADTELDPAVALLSSQLSQSALKTLLELNDSSQSASANQIYQAAARLQQQIQLAKQKQQLQQQLLLQQQQQRQRQQQLQQAMTTITQVAQNSAVAAGNTQRQLKLILQQPLATVASTPVSTQVSATAQQPVHQVASTQVQVVNSQPVQVTAAPATVPTQSIGQVSLQQLQQVKNRLLLLQVWHQFKKRREKVHCCICCGLGWVFPWLGKYLSPFFDLQQNSDGGGGG